MGCLRSLLSDKACEKLPTNLCYSGSISRNDVKHSHKEFNRE